MTTRKTTKTELFEERYQYKGDKKSNIVFRVSTVERKMIKAMAKDNGKTISAYIIYLIHKEYIRVNT